MSEESVKLFISYSHRDETLRQQLDKHLAPLKGQKVIEAWHDRQLRAGDEWADQIDDNLNKADIILLLISPDFVASDYCSNIELSQAMQRHENGDAIVVPVILEPCDWSWLPFAKLQAFPKDGKAIAIWTNQNEAFVDVAKGIRTTAQTLLEQRQQKAAQKKALKERFLKKVEEALSDSVISDIERDTLDELREELGLTAEEAGEIELQAYEPYRKYEKDRENYRKTLTKLIEKGCYPFSDEIRKELELRQRDLGLKEVDVKRIEQPILAEAEAKYQERLQAGASGQERQPNKAAATLRPPEREEQPEALSRTLQASDEGKMEAALVDFPQASELAPDKTDAYSSRDNAYSESGNNNRTSTDADTARQNSMPLEFKLFAELNGHSGWFAAVRTVAISPDGQTIASGSEDYTIKLWDRKTGRELRTLAGHAEAIYSVAFSPAGEVLASGSADDTVKLWDWQTGREICTFSGHSGDVMALAFSPDGEILASGSADKIVKLWNWKTKQEINFFEHSDDVRSVAFSSDGGILAVLCNWEVKLWNFGTGEIPMLKPADGSGAKYAMALSPDGRTMALGSQDGNVELWDVTTGGLRQTFSAHKGSILDGAIESVAFSPDGQVLASAGANNKDKSIKLWRLATGELLQTLTGHEKGVSAVVFSPDGQALISGSYDKTVRIWCYSLQEK